MAMKTFNPVEESNPWMSKTLLSAVGPRPIAFASTVDKDGRPNLAPFSFFNAFGVNPTTLIFSPSRRGRNNTVKNTYENVKEVPEVVINVVTYDIVQQTSLASTEYDKGVNEFVKAGFTPVPSETIQPARVGESPVQFECKVRDVIETGGAGSANLVICEVQRVHIREDLLDEENMIDQNKIDLVGRMGGNYYARAHGDALFEVEKPLRKKGMGIDQLPDHIKHSSILTGNDLGKLGNTETFPDKETVEKIKEEPEVKEILLDKSLTPQQKKLEIQRLASVYLSENESMKAFALLMIKM